MIRASTASSCLLIFLAASGPLLAIDPIAVPLGEPELVTETTAYLYRPLVDMAADGSFVISWMDGSPGELERAKVRLFAADGIPSSPPLSIGTNTQALSGAPGGGFVTVGVREGATAGSHFLEAKLFDAQGAYLRSTEVAAQTGNYAAIDHDAEGNFVVAYAAGHFHFRAARFDADGFPRGDSFEVAGPLSFGAGNVDVAVAPDGSFTVFFEEGGPETDAKLSRRRYDRKGQPLEAAFPVPPQQEQRASRAAVAADGSTVVTYHRGLNHVDGRFFGGGGQLGAIFGLVAPAGERGHGGDGVFLAGGDFIGASNIDDGVQVHSRLQRVGRDGQIRGPRLPIEREGGDFFGYVPSVGGHGDRLAIAWSGPQGRIYYQRFEATLFADGFESADLSGWH